MNLSPLYGNETIKTVLNTHLFHAYLIEGPEGSGKRTLADLLTNALVCEDENSPCGKCRQCYKFREKCHPDIFDIPYDVPVEELRSILAGVALKPNDGSHKIYRIEHAEKLHPAAQNLLLKTLEEPPPYAVFLLLTASKEGVLQTVRSRCQTLTMAPLPEEIILQHFEKKYGKRDDRARAAALMSSGFLGRAISLYETEDETNLTHCKKLDEALHKGNVTEVFRLLSFTERSDLVSFYKTFSVYLKRCLRETGAERAFYAGLSYRWDGVEEALQSNVNVKFWSTNLARIGLNAAKEQLKRKDTSHD